MSIDYSKVTKNKKVIRLLKKREAIANKIRKIEKEAIFLYELEAIK